MSIERQALAAIVRNRDAWSRISKHIDPEAFTPYGKLVMSLATDYYDRDAEAKAIPLDTMTAIIETRFQQSAKHKDLYTDFVRTVYGTEVSAANITELVLEVKRKDVGNRLGTALLNDEKPSKINELLDAYTELDAGDSAVDTEEIYEGGAVTALVESNFDPANRIKVLPKSLDTALGSKLKRGHHIVVFARPETGKTAITLTLARAFALQGLRFIIFGNEEPVADTRMRMASCLTGMTAEQIKDNPEAAQKLLDERNWNNIIFIPLTPGTPREIERYLERYKPDGFAVDQVRNMNVGAETRVNQLEMAATSIRNLAKKHNCVGVSITQSGDSGEGKLILTMGDIDFSNTGIPATADVMIGAGVNAEFDAQGMRMFNLPKNKVSAQHIHWPVKINQALSRIEDIE